jgi:hypothetical protein
VEIGNAEHFGPKGRNNLGILGVIGDLKTTVCERVDCVLLLSGGFRWQALVNTVVSSRFFLRGEKFY